MTTPEPDQVPDLVRRAQSGDTVAMNALIDTLTPYVGRLCGPIALQDAPDAVQETFIVVFRGLRTLREPAALFGWVRTVAVREAVRVAQKAARARLAELEDIPAPGSPELAADIRDVLDRLSPEHRAILVLREIEGLSETEAGRLLAIAPGTAKSRLSRAKDSFRKAWSA